MTVIDSVLSITPIPPRALPNKMSPQLSVAPPIPSSKLPTKPTIKKIVIEVLTPNLSMIYPPKSGKITFGKQ